MSERADIGDSIAAVSGFAFRWGAASDVGKLREENEDAYFIEPEIGLFLVTDGMGGHRGGELASKIVVEDLPPMIENGLNKLRSPSPRAIRSLLKKTVAEQSNQLRMEGGSENGYTEMGATVALALLVDGRAYIANVGDSRVYCFRKGRLSQLTKDHSVVSELLEQGKIEPEEVKNHVAQGQITRYVGMDRIARAHVRSFALRKRDRLLLCTDGLTDIVDDKNIAVELSKKVDSQDICNALVKLANAGGGTDNITVVIADWLGH
jgi:serine/threonine protein phosphatase PrpC